MADYSPSLGVRLFRDFSTLLENRVMYPMDDSHIFPMPEFIAVFSRYSVPVSPMREADILNSLFVMPMLSQLGTLHEELNYREAKKLHPQLIQMITQKWSARSSLRAARSIYDESFTEDFKYHEYGDQLEQNVAKGAWMYRAMDTFATLMVKHYSGFMDVEQIKEHMQEHFSLLNIYRSYLSDDENSKNGRYMDVVSNSAGVKYYSKNYGYESILPYIYRASSAYPTDPLKSLESEHGFKSSGQEYERGKRYRGDIHAYFNNLILKGLSSRISSQ